MIMKKIFTLIAASFVALGMNAQEIEYEVTDVITNGDFSGSDLGNFAVHEWRPGETTQSSGAPIVEDGCAKVYVRSEAQAREAGNATLDNGNFAAWDSQFFITWPDFGPLEANDKIQLKMRVKADVPFTADTQSHDTPGAYMHWFGVGDIAFTTEWTDVVTDTYVMGNGDWGKFQVGAHTIAFNLAKATVQQQQAVIDEETGEQAVDSLGNPVFETINVSVENNVYFDDIQVLISRPTVPPPTVIAKSMDVTLTSRSWPEGVEDWSVVEYDENGVVSSWVRSVEQAAADGNAVTTDGKELAEDNGNFADWDSQFFISWPEDYALQAGDKVKFTMSVKADVAASVGTQCHAAPGGYLFYYAVGDVNFKTEWSDFDSGFIPVVAGEQWGNAIAGTYTIAFNLAKGVENTYYFKDVAVLLQSERNGTTEIKQIAITPQMNQMYNLAGQRVDASYKGIVLKNGKKFIQK